MTDGRLPAKVSVLAPVHPQVSGAAQFNTAMMLALQDLTAVHAVSWRQLYPPIIHRRDTDDHASRPRRLPSAEPLLSWSDPRSWRRALAQVRAAGSQALILPWVHPVMAPPYRYLLRNAPRGVRRIVICHNVEPHEPVRFGPALTRSVLRHADVLVIHAAQQRAELARLGVADRPIVGAFHPRFSAADLGRVPSAEQLAAERRRQGEPALSLLAFGAIRPYKGIDLALEALARGCEQVDARLTVAGVFWDGGAELRTLVRTLGVGDRVELRDGFVTNEDAALLFGAADACVLPYRSATQSGVAQLSFAYGVPVIATSVGGLTEAIRDGVDGLLVAPRDVAALARAIQRMAREHKRLAAGVQAGSERHSFARYAQLLCDAVGVELAEPSPRRASPTVEALA